MKSRPGVRYIHHPLLGLSLTNAEHQKKKKAHNWTKLATPPRRVILSPFGVLQDEMMNDDDYDYDYFI